MVEGLFKHIYIYIYIYTVCIFDDVGFHIICDFIFAVCDEIILKHISIISRRVLHARQC